MNIKRILMHWRLAPWLVKRRFSPAILKTIQDAIAASEHLHRGELRFVVEGHLPSWRLLRGLTARQRAEQLFDQLGIGNTAEHSGILIYVLFAERQVEIVADRGITACVPQTEWDALCVRMTRLFASEQYRSGALAGIEGATELLRTHFPARPDNPNELDDVPLIL